MTDATYTQPEWDRSALLVIDVQNDFVDEHGALPVAGTREAVGAMTSILDAFRGARRPIAHVIRLYVPGGSDTDLPRRAAIESGLEVVAPGTAGSQIPDELRPGDTALDAEKLLAGQPQQLGPDEIALYKPRWSAFHRTVLHEWLRQRDVTTIVVAGCNLPNCPRATLFDASNHDYRTVLVTDATSQVTEDRLADLELIGTNLATAREVAERVAAGLVES